MKQWIVVIGLVAVGCGADVDPGEQAPEEIETSSAALFNGTFTIRENMGPGKRCWDIEGGSTATDARAQLFGCHFGPNQQFRFTSRGGNFWAIQPVNSNLCLGASDSPDSPGGSIYSAKQWTCIGDFHRYMQTWEVTRRGTALGDVAWYLRPSNHTKVGPISDGIDNHIASGGGLMAFYIVDMNGTPRF